MGGLTDLRKRSCLKRFPQGSGYRRSLAQVPAPLFPAAKRSFEDNCVDSLLPKLTLRALSISHGSRRLDSQTEFGNEEEGRNRRCVAKERLPYGTTSGFGPAFSFNAWVNSCKPETIWGAFVSTVLASFSE